MGIPTDVHTFNKVLSQGCIVLKNILLNTYTIINLPLSPVRLPGSGMCTENSVLRCQVLKGNGVL